MRDAARRLERDIPGLGVAVAAEAEGGVHEGGSWVYSSDARAVASAADGGICKSGTITLESALLGMPMVVAYRVHPWTATLARKLLRVDHVGLVNLIADRPVVPELLQDAVTPTALADAVRPLLDASAPPARAQRAAFEALRGQLGEPGASARVAELALGMAA
jgi:lipid-A-disaccharide synthase